MQQQSKQTRARHALSCGVDGERLHLLAGAMLLVGLVGCFSKPAQPGAEVATDGPVSNSGCASSAKWPEGAALRRAHAVHAGDLDADGYRDLVLVAETSTGNASLVTYFGRTAPLALDCPDAVTLLNGFTTVSRVEIVQQAGAARVIVWGEAAASMRRIQLWTLAGRSATAVTNTVASTATVVGRTTPIGMIGAGSSSALLVGAGQALWRASWQTGVLESVTNSSNLVLLEVLGGAALTAAGYSTNLALANNKITGTVTTVGAGGVALTRRADPYLLGTYIDDGNTKVLVQGAMQANRGLSGREMVTDLWIEDGFAGQDKPSLFAVRPMDGRFRVDYDMAVDQGDLSDVTFEGSVAMATPAAPQIIAGNFAGGTTKQLLVISPGAVSTATTVPALACYVAGQATGTAPQPCLVACGQTVCAK